MDGEMCGMVAFSLLFSLNQLHIIVCFVLQDIHYAVFNVCQIGRERETAVCLMQKYIDKGSELQIRSAIALDHLKNYIYIEADKEAHVREVCSFMSTLALCYYLV